MNMRNFAIWAVIGVVLFGIYGLVNAGANGAAPVPIKYSEMLDKIGTQYNVLGVFDDRPSVARAWRAAGLKVFQVGDPHIEF